MSTLYIVGNASKSRRVNRMLLLLGLLLYGVSFMYIYKLTPGRRFSALFGLYIDTYTKTYIYINVQVNWTQINAGIRGKSDRLKYRNHFQKYI